MKLCSKSSSSATIVAFIFAVINASLYLSSSVPYTEALKSNIFPTRKLSQQPCFTSSSFASKNGTFKRKNSFQSRQDLKLNVISSKELLSEKKSVSSRRLNRNITSSSYQKARTSLAMQQLPTKKETSYDTRSANNVLQQRGGTSTKKKQEKALPSSVTYTQAPISFKERIQNTIGDVQDAKIVLTYICTQMGLSLPVVLIPVIAADPFAPGVEMTISTAMFVGSLVSFSTLGAGCGKFINGFVVQAIGGRLAGSIYMFGLAMFALMLSTTYTMHGYAIAGMEFCSSCMWTALTVLMAERYESDATKFTSAIMKLSLASTTGTLLAKVIGGALLSQFNWRSVCLLSTAVGLIGSALLFSTRPSHELVNPSSSTSPRNKVIDMDSGKEIKLRPGKGLPSLSSLQATITNVLGNKFTWIIGLSHFTAFIVRSCDKVLGTFIVDATDLPRYLAGSLTTSVTLGFIAGLVSGKKVEDLDSLGEKKTYLYKRYLTSVVCALGLAALSTESVGALFTPTALAAAITIVSGLLATFIGFQFYQLPPKYATTYGQDKAVFISWMDGFGFLLLSPFWSTLQGGVAKLGMQGWTNTWLTVAAFIFAGGSVMTYNLGTIMQIDEDEKKN